MNASLVTVFKSTLTSAAGVNLGFDHNRLSGRQMGERLIEFLLVLGNGSIGDRNTRIGKEFFRLVFVNVHRK